MTLNLSTLQNYYNNMVRTTIELNSAPYNGEVMLYQTADGRVSIDVILVNESVWLTQDQLAILFERDKSVISRHIKNVFSEGELDPKVVIAKNAIKIFLQIY